MRVGVEAFGPLGGGPLNKADTTSFNLVSGGTVIFVTDTAFGLEADVNLGLAKLGTVAKGSARILSTSKKLVCTAFLLDNSASAPVSMTYLIIVAKAQQKAAN
jgi:hypothetical protein